MSTRFLAAAAALCLAAAPAFAQPSNDVLPDGPGKDVVMRVCTACHEATQFEYARMTPEQWDMTISKMQTNGAVMSADEQRAISAYLGHYLSPTSPPTAAAPPAGAAPAAPPAPSAAPPASPQSR